MIYWESTNIWQTVFVDQLSIISFERQIQKPITSFEEREKMLIM